MITNSDDIIDIREIAERIAELRGELASTDEDEELGLLIELQRDIEDRNFGGAELIRESYFEKYTQRYAEDSGAIKDAYGWPCMYIDWERAVADLRMDWSALDFDGVTYYVRS